MKVIRTFVAVLLDEDLRHKIARVQAGVRKLAPDMRWVNPDCFHITLKFLGDVAEDDLPDVAAAVGDAAVQIKPYILAVSGLGVFPNIRRPRTLWIGISDGAEQITELAQSIDKALSKAGNKGDEKPFHPHIALSRARERGAPRELAAAIEKTNADGIGRQMVDKVAVMGSELTSTGPVYTVLHSLPLGQTSC